MVVIDSAQSRRFSSSIPTIRAEGRGDVMGMRIGNLYSRPQKQKT